METYLKAAEACHKAGFPFGDRSRRNDGLGRHRRRDHSRPSAPSWSTSQGQGHGQDRCRPPVRSSTSSVKCAKFYPPDAPAWDDASNNKWLVAGKGALIMNPPSAWAVAKRDAPQIAEQCWTHGFPSGPKGRFAPLPALLPGASGASAKNKPAAKSLLVFLSQPAAVEKLVAASGRLRPAVVREADHAQDLGRGRAAEGHALPLPQSVQPSDAVDRGFARRRPRSRSRSTHRPRTPR